MVNKKNGSKDNQSNDKVIPDLWQTDPDTGEKFLHVSKGNVEEDAEGKYYDYEYMDENGDSKLERVRVNQKPLKKTR